MRFRPHRILALVLAFGAGTAHAQDVLTLDAAVAQALGANPALKATRSGQDEALARQDEAQSRFYPRITVSESWQRGNAPVFVFSSLLSARRFTAGNFAIDALNNPDSVGFFHGAVSVEQVLFDGGRTGFGVDTSKAMATMAGAASRQMELTLAVQVANGYGRLLTAEAARKASEAAAEAAAEDVARAERRRDAGTVTESDVLSLRVHLASMRQRAIEATGQARRGPRRAEPAARGRRSTPTSRSRNRRRRPPARPATGRPWPTRRWPTGRTSSAATPRWMLAAAGRRQAKGAWWPQVAAQGAYQYDGLDFSNRASAWVVGGEARWTFATGMGDRAATKAAVAAEQRARASREDARAAVQVDVLSAVRQLRERAKPARPSRAPASRRRVRVSASSATATTPAWRASRTCSAPPRRC